MATLGRVVRDRWLAAGVVLLGVVVYTVLVGCDAAVVRAAVMGIVTIIGVAVRRLGLAYNLLAFAPLVMTAFNPDTGRNYTNILNWLSSPPFYRLLSNYLHFSYFFPIQ